MCKVQRQQHNLSDFPFFYLVGPLPEQMALIWTCQQYSLQYLHSLGICFGYHANIRLKSFDWVTTLQTGSPALTITELVHN